MNFNGLWYTSEGYFVIVSDKEAKWMNPDTKLFDNEALHTVDEKGVVCCCGKLMTRRLGEERYVAGSSIEWPIVKEVL